MAHTVRTETFLDTGCSHILEDIATAVAGLTLGDLGNSEATVYGNNTCSLWFMCDGVDIYCLSI